MDKQAYINTLVERLTALTPDFKRMRKQLTLSLNVGLGVFPEAHGEFCSACILSLNPVDSSPYGKWMYKLPQRNYFKIMCENGLAPVKEYIIIAPRGKKRYVVSVYHKAENREGGCEERLVKAEDDVFRGLFAHELGHRVDKRKKSILSCSINKLLESITDGREIRVDIIAARLGYRREIIAMLDYHITCLNTYELPSTGSVKTQDAQEFFTLSKQLVEQYG